MQRIGLCLLIALATACASSQRPAATTASSPSPSASPSPSESATTTPASAPPSADRLEVALRAFMDARMRRDANAATAYLSANAKQQYDAHEGGLQLVSPTSNPHFDRYVIERRDEVDANSSEFVVRVHEAYTGQSYDSSFVETIGVGPGANTAGQQLPAVIRFARR